MPIEPIICSLSTIIWVFLEVWYNFVPFKQLRYEQNISVYFFNGIIETLFKLMK